MATFLDVPENQVGNHISVIAGNETRIVAMVVDDPFGIDKGIFRCTEQLGR